MHNRPLNNIDLSETISRALGKTAEEIQKSEAFEQAVYNFARTIATDLPELDITGQAQFSLQNERITIIYKTDIDLKKLAAFYNSYFPETHPGITYYFSGDSLHFLADKFIEKVLPAMELWKLAPSQLPATLHEDLEATTRGPSIMVARC